MSFYFFPLGLFARSDSFCLSEDLVEISALLSSLEDLKLDCEYWDVRIEDVCESRVIVKDHELNTAVEHKSLGAFLRLRKNGNWTYSATTNLENIISDLKDLCKSPSFGRSTAWKDLPPSFGKVDLIQYAQNNFMKVSLATKVKLTLRYDELLKDMEFQTNCASSYADVYKTKYFINSVGTSYRYDFNQGGLVISFDLAKGERKFSDYTSYYGQSLEDFKELDSKIIEYVKGASVFLDAPMVEPGKYNLLLSPELTGVFVHESFGHMSEADALLGDSLAKESWKIGSKVAAEFVSILDDGNFQSGSGYCPIDDEGFLAKKNYLIKDGILVGRLHSYDTAQEMNEDPTGNGRAIDFENSPIVRMTSTYMDNGTTPLKELYKNAEGAIFIENFDHGSGGEMFSIAPRRCYFIKDGEPKVPIRMNSITGQIFETLKNIEALGDNFSLKHSAFGGCGKAQQFPLPVSDGGPTILVKGMQVS